MSDQDYIRDALEELLQRARAAAATAKESRKAGANGAFEAGVAQGYYEALSVLLNRLDAFGINRTSVGVPEELKLEKELL